jgi:hypothetical protein
MLDPVFERGGGYTLYTSRLIFHLKDLIDLFSSVRSCFGEKQLMGVPDHMMQSV